MPLVLRGIGLESGILVQKFAVRQGSAGRCKHRPLQMFVGLQQIFTFLGGVGCPTLPGKLPFPHKTKHPRPYSSCHAAKTKAGVFFNARG